MPKTEIDAGIGLEQPDDHAQRGGLAGAVRPEQGVELAGAHGEIEMVDRRALEGLAEAGEAQGRRLNGHRPCGPRRKRCSVLPYMVGIEAR